MAVKWFAVKTLYRSVTSDRPEKPDLSYDPDTTMLEERILLIKAHDRAEAVVKAEREANDYAAKGVCYNPYNQKITTYDLGCCDVFELSETPADKSEIFVTTRLLSRNVSDGKVVHIYLGNPRAHDAKGKGKKFINREYSSEVT